VSSFTILRRGVGARHAEMDALREKKLPGAGVIELTLVVTLDNLDACTELGGGLGDEGSECANCVRFET
jgi:hypothetical protein